ncbi:unnamed protein product [Jaminaea pallidilutea]
MMSGSAAPKVQRATPSSSGSPLQHSTRRRGAAKSDKAQRSHQASISSFLTKRDDAGAKKGVGASQVPTAPESREQAGGSKSAVQHHGSVPVSNARLAALGREWTPTQTQSYSERHTEPDAGALVSPQKTDDEDEERQWLERARRIRGGTDQRIHIPQTRRSSMANGVKGQPTDQHLELIRQQSSDEENELPPSQEIAAIDINRRDPVTPANKRQRRRLSDASPQTPFMHDSLSDFSMLPWEFEAQRKATDYRVSAGLKPTAASVSARKKAERDAFTLARHRANARFTGQTRLAEQHSPSAQNSARNTRPAQHDSENGAVHTTPSLRGTAVNGRLERPAKRQALSPLPLPNSEERTQNKKPVSAHAGHTPSERLERKEASGRSAREDANTPRPRGLPRSNVLHGTPQTPLLPLSAILSPRSKRKVYALETQDHMPHSEEVADLRLQLEDPTKNNHLLGEKSPRSLGQSKAANLAYLPRLPTDPAERQRILDRISDSPLTSDPDDKIAQVRVGQRNADVGQRHAVAAGTSSSPSGSEPSSDPPHRRDGPAYDETYQDPAAAKRPLAIPARRLQPRRASKSVSPKKGSILRKTPARNIEAADGEGVDGNLSALRGGHALGGVKPASPSSQETQLLSSDYDDSDEENVISAPPGRATGHDRTTADVEEATQPLPFSDSDGSASEEEMISRPIQRRSTSVRSPSHPAKSRRLTGWASVNDAWAGRMPIRRQATQSTLGQHGFDESTQMHRNKKQERPQMIGAEPRSMSATERERYAEHPLSRDIVDELSEPEEEGDSGQASKRKRGSQHRADDSGFMDVGDAADAGDAEATQPLPWPRSSQTASSHTEDETTASGDLPWSSQDASWVPGRDSLNQGSLGGRMESFWQRL